MNNIRYNLLVGVNKLNMVRNLQPSSGWSSSDVQWRVKLECNDCGEKSYHTFSQELNIWCQRQGCQSWGRFAVLKKKGRPLQNSGDSVLVRSISVEGSFTMDFDEFESFDFTWSFRVVQGEDDDDGIDVDEVELDDNGSYAYKPDSDDSDEDEYFGYQDIGDDDEVHYIKEVWVHCIKVDAHLDLLTSSSSSDDN